MSSIYGFHNTSEEIRLSKDVQDSKHGYEGCSIMRNLYAGVLATWNDLVNFFHASDHIQAPYRGLLMGMQHPKSRSTYSVLM